MQTKTEKYLRGLKNVFASAHDKHEANYRSRDILTEMSADADFLTEVIRSHLEKPGSLNTLHYPVLSFDVVLNEYFGLVVNCWIPLPNRATDISTKAIHHHGDMLLSTATAFGPGYEHWTFETPSVVDAGAEVYKLNVLEQSAHPLNHVAFVDSYIAHLPLYPAALTITYALWSSRFPTSWRDKVKRLPLIRGNGSRLRDLAARAGLAKTLELKVVEYFDFYPTCDGFRGIRERKEFDRTTNEDYLASLFHIIQETGNSKLASVIREKLSSGERIDNPASIRRLLADLESGRSVDAVLPEQHFNMLGANFSKAEILQALAAQKTRHCEN